MSESVKRDYRSTLRAAQSADTRRLIVSAAARLFVESGYGATTIDAVAEAAGVSRKTVFTSVGGKVELLKTALDWAVAGDDRPVPIAARTELRDILGRDDPVALITDWVAIMVQIDVRCASLFAVLEIAADADEGARHVLEEAQQQRLVDARRMIRRLVQLDAYDKPQSRANAVDIAWLATDPMLYDRFVRIRGWSVPSFETWLARTLIAQLLAPGCQDAQAR